MPNIYLIRHTTPNIAKGIWYGRLDVDVAASFATEAAGILAALSTANIATFYSSPAQRCSKLAHHLAGENRVQIDPRLQEINFGQWEGKNFNDIPRAQIDAWAADVENYVMPRGESPAMCRDRAQLFFNEHIQTATQNCAVIAHGGSIKALLSIVANQPLAAVAQWEIAFGAVVAFKL